MERLIGDYLDLNYAITQEKINTKRFKFFANFKANKRYKRLIKSAQKIKNAKYKLNKENLSELFSFIYSNYDGNFECIKKVIISDNTNSITGMMQTDDYSVAIIINNTDTEFDFQGIFYDADKNKNSYSVTSKELSFHNNLILDNYMEKLNKDLLIAVSDYIVEYISNFLRKD